MSKRYRLAFAIFDRIKHKVGGLPDWRVHKISTKYILLGTTLSDFVTESGIVSLWCSCVQRKATVD